MMPDRFPLVVDRPIGREILLSSVIKSQLRIERNVVTASQIDCPTK